MGVRAGLWLVVCLTTAAALTREELLQALDTPQLHQPLQERWAAVTVISE